MRSIWAVARQTFAQCLRMKLAGLFIVLLGVVVLAMPFAMKGDGTLAGQIRTFLSYSMSLMTVLLMLVTVFLAVGTVSADIEDRHVFMLASKPLGRGNYIIGRWLGVVMFDAMLVLASGIVIYSIAQYLRGGKVLNANDRRAVEMEVFSSRAKIPPDPIDEEIRKGIENRVKKLKEDKNYEAALQAFMDQTGGDRQAAEEKFYRELETQVTEGLQSIMPGRYLDLSFSNIRTTGNEVRATGKVLSTRENKEKKQLFFEVAAPRRFLGHLVEGYPLKISNTDAWVSELRDETFIGVMDSGSVEGAGVKADAELNMLAPPVIQLSYQVIPSKRTLDDTVTSVWVVMDGKGQPVYEPMIRQDPNRVQTMLLIPADVVGDDGRITVRYVNPDFGNPDANNVVRLEYKDISVLYRVGSFEMNFIRGLLLVLVQMMFLAAVGVLAGTFLSFAVGCLASFTVLPFSLAREFLSDAVKLQPDGGNDFWTTGGHYIYQVLQTVLPDLGSLSVSDYLVDGVAMSWSMVALSTLLTVGVRTLIVLMLAWLVFLRRELARVQV